MLILFDQGTPVGIRHALTHHIVKTAREQGWSTLLNLGPGAWSRYQVSRLGDGNVAGEDGAKNAVGRRYGTRAASRGASRSGVGRLPHLCSAYDGGGAHQ